jgi:squalene-associated FAD-dependent desaturase
LLLSGNSAALAYIDRIGARDTFEPAGEAAIPFVDLADDTQWTVRPSRGRVPWWLLSGARRIPGTKAADYLEVLRLWRSRSDDTVGNVLAQDGTLYRRLWEPLAVAALNTAAADGSADLFRRILVETMGRGAEACRPLLPREGLSESLVDPALAFLRGRGADIRFGALLRELRFETDGVAELRFDDGAVAVQREDAVILAVPAAIAGRLVPDLVVPDDYAPIVNAHYRYAPPPGRPAFIGVIGGNAEWVFRKSHVLSVTVSAADRLVDLPTSELRDLLWRDVARVFALPVEPVPPARIVKERRATFRATPAQAVRRPAAATRWNNFHLAGDYVETGLPATIEGAIRSGFAAAARIGQRRTPVTAALPVPAPRPSEAFEDRSRALP